MIPIPFTDKTKIHFPDAQRFQQLCAVAAPNLQLNARILPVKVRGRLRYPGIGCAVGRPNSDRTRLQSADARRNLLAHVLTMQQLLHRRKQLLTRSCGTNPIPLTPKQRKTILFLQCRDHPADGRRRIPKFSRRPRQTARLHHTHQRPIFFQLHIRSSSASFISHSLSASAILSARPSSS